MTILIGVVLLAVIYTVVEIVINMINDVTIP